MSEDAGTKLANNLKFNHKTLLETVRRLLEARKLITTNADATLPKISITITDVRVRSTFSAIMFGFMAGSDKIAGDVEVANTDGSVIQQFKVDVSYALGGIAGGQDSSRMDWLYESFAEETVRALTGEKKDAS